MRRYRDISGNGQIFNWMEWKAFQFAFAAVGGDSFRISLLSRLVTALVLLQYLKLVHGTSAQ